MSRTIAIGDVHGCAEEFAQLLELIDPQEEDRVIQLGDLINRGPDSHSVIRIAHQYKVEAILGNHEHRILTALREKRPELLKDYDLETIKQLNNEDWIYLENLPKFKYSGLSDTVFIHGGFLPGQLWTNQSIEITTTIQVIDADGRPAKRSDAPDAPAWADSWKGPPFVIYGHTPRPEVYQLKDSIGIDTGCVYGGYLTAYIVEEKRLIQVRANRAYALSKRLPCPV